MTIQEQKQALCLQIWEICRRELSAIYPRRPLPCFEPPADMAISCHFRCVSAFFACGHSPWSSMENDAARTSFVEGKAPILMSSSIFWGERGVLPMMRKAFSRTVSWGSASLCSFWHSMICSTAISSARGDILLWF